MRKHRLFPGMLCLVILLASLAGCAEAPHRSASPAPAPTWTPAGRLNTNNSNPALTGFWIESSLLISPKEQADVMARIFGDRAEGAQEVREPLQRAMLLTEQEDLSLYGKTGMGKRHGVVVDAWYTGFADGFGKRIYFCVYLGETDGRDVSSARAREIAVALVSDCLRAGRPEDP